MGRGISLILRAVTEGDVVFAPRDRGVYIRPPWQLSLVAFLETEQGVDYVFSHIDSNIPHYVTARELIDAGEIGELLQVTANYWCGLSHNGSHGIDAMRFLAADGNVSWVFGEIESDEIAQGEYDPQGNGYLVFDNGVRGFLRSLDCGPIAARDFDVLGTQGRIRIMEGLNEYEFWKSVPSGPEGSMQQARMPYPMPLRPQGMGLTIIDDILNSVEIGGQPRCSGVDSRQALEVAVALRESHRRGFARVDLPLEDRSLGIVSAEMPHDDLPARVRREQEG